MKLAEALIKIKDLKNKFSELQSTVHDNALFDVVDERSETPSHDELIAEMVIASEEITRLKTCIAKTNATHGLVDKIHEMEHLRSCVSQLSSLAKNKQSVFQFKTIDYGSPPVKVETRATYNVDAVDKMVDGFRDKVRKIDLELQRLNWEVDLVE